MNRVRWLAKLARDVRAATREDGVGVGRIARDLVALNLHNQLGVRAYFQYRLFDRSISPAAHVLSNRQPPYSIRGGVYDVLTESEGDMLAADNLETLPRLQLFEEIEGIDIDPASAVAFATLLKAARSGLLDHDALVLLNVTGGGRYRRHRDQQLIPARPALQLDQQEINLDGTLGRIANLFQ